MNRQNLIQRLVDRKLQSAADAKTFCWNCICIASPTNRSLPAAGKGRLDQAAALPRK